jgi:hypothetical protein
MTSEDPPTCDGAFARVIDGRNEDDEDDAMRAE